MIPFNPEFILKKCHSSASIMGGVRQKKVKSGYRMVSPLKVDETMEADVDDTYIDQNQTTPRPRSVGCLTRETRVR
jgi:hypothetical protein